MLTYGPDTANYGLRSSRQTSSAIKKVQRVEVIVKTKFYDYLTT